MKRILWAGLLFSVSARGEDVPMPPEFAPAREAIERGIQGGLSPSLALAVVKDDRVVWAEGFGLADLERKRRATSDTIYILASVSKPLTATGLMVLVERGKIDLDRPANDYLPGAKLRARRGSAAEMTVRRLANHTAGMPVHYNFYYAGAEPLSWDETIRRYGFAAFEPGSRWEYSNLAFGILGYITEAVSGTPWRQFLEKEVFDPLGMSRTSDIVRPGREEDAAVQYGPDAAGRFIALGSYGFDHPGASALRSSASDLARFLRMHLNGGVLDGKRVLSPEGTLAMQRMTGRNGPQSGTGIGWAIDSYRGHASFSHSGGMPGVATMIRAFPADRAAIVVLTNSHGSSLAGDVTRRIARVLLGENWESPRAPAAPEEPEPSTVTGTWEGRLEHFDGDVPLRLTVEEGGAVQVSLGGRPAGKLKDPFLKGPRLRGRVAAVLRTQEGFHGIPDIELNLERDGDRLVGVGVALAEGYFALSHWVELTARPGPPAATARAERRFAQAEVPAFWKGRVEEIESAVIALKRGKAGVIARSPGGRPVHLVQYGARVDFQRQANWSSALGAGDPAFYARKPPGTPPVVLIVGPCHGQEVEGMVGTVNLLQVAETGRDLRGKEWPRLRDGLDRLRLLLVPVSNPDGRARCPYDSFVGIPVDEMTRVGQGTRIDGTLYGWPGAKQRHPMVGDVGLLGAYFNDHGVNLMHDEFFAPMAEETRALLRVARDEAPDYVLLLHSHGVAPQVLATSYVPRFQKEATRRFAERLMERYRSAGLPAGGLPAVAEDGTSNPPPSYNLTSALHHACGGLSMLFECPHGVKEPQYPQVNHEQILDLELMLFEELVTFALEKPGG